MAGAALDAVLVDHSVGMEAAAEVAAAARDTIARRIILITPGERHRLPDSRRKASPATW